MSVLDFILSLGPSILMPIILLAMALAFRVPPSTAVRSSLTVGMGFIGVNLVLGLLLSTLGPVTDAMVSNLGIELNVLDAGWPPAAAIAYGNTAVFPWFFILALGINFVLLILKWTKTIDIDVWNYWWFILGAAFLNVVIDNLIVSVAVALLVFVVVLKFADWTAPVVSKFFGLPGVSLPHMGTASWIPLGWSLNAVLRRVPGLRRNAGDPDEVLRRMGFLGEPMILGTAIGLVIGLLAYGPQVLGDYTKIADILTVAMTVGAVMLIFPRMVRLLMDGLIPISEGVRSFLHKRFPGRDVLIGLDAAVVAGNPFAVAVGLLLIPITILLAVGLSVIGVNRMIPLGDLAVMPFFAIWAVGFARANIARAVVIGTAFMTFALTIGTYFASSLTELALSVNFQLPEASAEISALTVGQYIMFWLPLVFQSFLGSYSPVALGVVGVLVAIAIASYAAFIVQALRGRLYVKDELEDAQPSALSRQTSQGSA